MTVRLPIVGSDDNTWGDILNSFLEVSHNDDGSLKLSALTSAGGESTANKGVASGYASLDSNGNVPSAQLGNVASAPVTSVAGRTGAITLAESDITNLSTDLSNKVSLGGDLGGTASAPTIAKLQGTVLNGSSPSDQQVLIYSAADSAWILGTVSNTTVNDATTSSKGIVELSGDLGGTASSPTVIATTLSSPLPVNQGGTGSTTQNFVDLTTTQSSIGGTKTFTGNITAPAVVASGLSGATAASRYVGATASGAPVSGTFAKGDYIADQTGTIWICTTAGSPGTWTQVVAGSASTVTTNANLTGPITSSGNVTAVASQTGTGSKFVMDTSPTLITPNLGTPSAVTLTNATGLPISTGVSGLGSGVATFLGTPSSANLASAVTGATGSGALVFGTSPTLTTPNLGTPSTLVGTNISGTAANLTAGNVTTNANLTGDVTSSGSNATTLANTANVQSVITTSQTKYAPTGLTGATAASRYVGATASGAPASGTFAVGDFVVDQTGAIWVCTTLGTPGTWTQVGGIAGNHGIEQTITSANTWQTIATLTPSATTMYTVAAVFEVASGTPTCGVQVTFADANGAQTVSITPTGTALSTGQWSSLVAQIVAHSGTAINVQVQASTTSSITASAKIIAT